MKKPSSLRQFLTEAVPWLKQNPDRLQLFASSGNVFTTGTGQLSYEVAYTLDVIVTDYALEPDTVFLPVLAWLRTHQPEMLQNPKLMADGFKFEIDFISHDSMDIAIKLALTERVVVTMVGNKVTFDYAVEPLLDVWEGYTFTFEENLP